MASARDGVPGAARTWVTFAGMVSGLPGDPRTANMRFSFHRPSAGSDAGTPPTLCAPTVRDVSISPSGAFSAQIPLDDPSSTCPSDMFDGRDIQVDVDVGAETLVRNASINPVPYAHFASVAGRALVATRVDPPACGWFRPDHPATGSAPFCQNFSQLARSAGWSQCLPRPSVVDAGFASRRYFISSDCRPAMEKVEGWTYFESRFASLDPTENNREEPNGALFISWNGANDITPNFWCCR